MTRAYRMLRRSLAILVLAFVFVAALAIMPTPAHAASACDGVLVSLDGCVAGVSLSPQQPTTKCAPAGTACATTNPPSTDQTPIVPKIAPAPPKRHDAPRPAVHRRVTPGLAPLLRFREADLDPSFTSGSFATTLPYDLPWFARRVGPPPANAPAPREEPGFSSLLAPIRVAMMYIGLGMLAAALGIRKILVAH